MASFFGLQSIYISIYQYIYLSIYLPIQEGSGVGADVMSQFQQLFGNLLNFLFYGSKVPLLCILYCTVGFMKMVHLCTLIISQSPCTQSAERTVFIKPAVSELKNITMIAIDLFFTLNYFNILIRLYR